MTNLAETPVWRTGIFQLETTTPVRGGAEGESNVPLLNLADRTAYLKAQTDALAAAVALRAPIASPDFTGAPLATTPPLSDDSRRIVTTEWVRDFLGSVTTINTTGGNVVLTANDAARGIIVVTGALTANATLILPAGSVGRWTIFNTTTGAFTLQARLSGTTPHAISTGAVRTFWAEGTTLRPSLTEAVDLALLGTPTAPTAPASTNNDQVASTAYARRFARGITSKVATAGATITLTDTEAAAPVIRLTGSPAAGFSVVFPGEGARWEVHNGTGQTATLKTAAQAGGVLLGGGKTTTVFADGTDILAAPTETRDHNLAGAPTATTPSALAAAKEVVTAEWVRNLLAGQAIYSTGDVKMTLKAVPDTGWVFLDGKSIGNAASRATARAHADAETLYTLLWTNLTNTEAPVAGGRGGSAAGDFAAGKAMTLPNAAGCALSGAGTGAGLTPRALGSRYGSESHVLTIAQIPEHNHGGATGAAGAHGHTAWTDAQGSHGHGAWSEGAGAHSHAAWTDAQGEHFHLHGSESLYNFFGGGDYVGNRNYPPSPADQVSWVRQRTSTVGAHSHNVGIGGIGDHAHAIGIVPSGEHSHNVGIGGAADHAHGIGAQGGNGAHPNVGPSLAVNVMVKL